ncbi:MAG: flavodoxin family protein [Methanosarcinaceae archaeon]|nr:flavodoxin family protein [Methanosarcinaceae archaeon]
MKSLIIYISIHHKNTEKIVKAMAEILNAELVKITEVNINELSKYDLIGFGSGIYFGQHHKSLLKLIDKLPNLKVKKAFIFSTSGMSNTGNLTYNIWHRITHFHVPLRKELINKAFDIIGEFDCRGFDTAGPFKFIGGINKGKPNEKDFENARKFAKNLII